MAVLINSKKATSRSPTPEDRLFVLPEYMPLLNQYGRRRYE